MSGPRVLFVDRGSGFFNAGSGTITNEFKTALQDHSLTAFMGDNAALQPGSLQEMMLHETAVAWIRRGLTRSLPPKPWEETIEAFGARLRGSGAEGQYRVQCAGPLQAAAAAGAGPA